LSERLRIRAGWVVPVDPEFRLIRDGAVLIEDGRIAAVGPARDIDGDRVRTLDYPHHALLPGLVNVHTHVAGCIFRGLTEDRADGFYGLALPMEPYLDADAIYALSRLGIAEVMLAGCTVIHDMFHHATETARAAFEMGVRAQVAHKVFDTDLPGIRFGRHDRIPAEGEKRLEESVRLHERWDGADQGRIEVRMGAHAADTCSPELLARIRAEAERRDAGLHIHTAQSPEERDFMQETYGTGSIEFLERQAFLGPRTVVAHVTYATDAGVALLAATRTPVAHCPAIVAKRGRFGPFKAMYELGVRIGWGTDWVTMDPWDAMRFGISAARLANREISLLSAREALWRSTMGSADVLGWSDRVGSLEPGKLADLILVDLDQPHLAPLHDPVSVLVYNASGRDVTHVMVGGRFLVDDRRLRTADARELVANAQEVANHVWRQGGLNPIGGAPAVAAAPIETVE
jgi:5-methylthioadenosine/S-adenosylhomocysteine deaminase